MKKNKAKGRALRDKYPQYVFTIEEVEELHKQVNDPAVLLDDSLKTKMLAKYSEIQKIRDFEFSFVKNQYSTIEEIEHFVQKINKFENIDLEKEKKVAAHKISVVRIG